jgi:hypothetical protein
MTDGGLSARLTVAISFVTSHLMCDLAQIVGRHVTVVLLIGKFVNEPKSCYSACRANAMSLSARSGTSAALDRKVN